MRKINWVRFLGAGTLAGLAGLSAGCYNGSSIKNGPDQAAANITAGKAFVTSLATTSPASFADLTSGFSNEVDASGLLTPKSLVASLGTALSDAGSFFQSQNGANGSGTFGSLTVTITNPSGTPVVTVGGTIGTEAVNLTLDDAQSSGTGNFLGAFASGSTISTSVGVGETITFNNATVAVATSDGQTIASGGANVSTIAIEGNISLAQLSGSSPTSFATTSGASSNFWLAACKNGTFCLTPYDLTGTFSEGADQITGHLEGALATPGAFDPTLPAGVGNVPVGQFQFLISGVTISSVPSNTSVAIVEELSGYYSDGVTQSPLGGFTARVVESGSELFQIQVNTQAPTSGIGPVMFTANLTNASGALGFVNPFTGETAGQVGKVSDDGTTLGTLTPAGSGALTLTYTDSTTAPIFDVTAVEGTIAAIFN